MDKASRARAAPVIESVVGFMDAVVVELCVIVVRDCCFFWLLLFVLGRYE